MEEENYESGISEYEKLKKNKKEKSNFFGSVRAKRICPHCRATSKYYALKKRCDNCGKIMEDFVIRSKQEVEKKENE